MRCSNLPPRALSTAKPFLLVLSKAAWLFLALRLCGAGLSAAEDTFHRLAVEESLTPIRPGSPGGSPFWNEQSKQFLWAPAFEFRKAQGAATYRFTLIAEDGSLHTFDAPEPWTALTRIWRDVPPGTADLKVEALNRQREVIGVAGTRQFHRGAVFNGPYGEPLLPYAQSARVALEGLMAEPFVQSWRKTGRPAEEYALYRYASKLIGAVMTASALYANLSPRPADAAEVVEVGRRAGDFLLGLSGLAGSPLEYFPPTYQGAKPGERENDNWTMLISPAEAGQGYLNLHEVTHDGKYLEAAKRIAATYRKLQLPSGTWHLKVNNQTGEPIAPNELIPPVVISFLDRLVVQYKAAEARPTRDRAVRWMMNNPVRTFDWSAQFDDARLRQPYQNLSKHEACEFAGYLFTHAGQDASQIAIAEELLRFAEDQFVVWERPTSPNSQFEKFRPENWFVPCSTEQYAMFEPISGSSAFMITTYVRAYQVTGKSLYRAKAESLGNALTAAQQHHGGRYPTRMYREDRTYWINSAVNTIRAMMMLAAAREPARGSP